MNRSRFSLAGVAFLAAAALFALAAPPALAAAGVSAEIVTHIDGSYAGANSLGSPAFAFNQLTTLRLGAGTSSGQADLMFADQRTLAASATENLDLAGVLVDPLGATLTFGHVKLIYIHAAATNTNDVCVGGAATNTFSGPFADPTDKVCVKPGAVAFLTVFTGVGWTVTPATGDILKVANSSSGTSVVYDVVILGTST